MNREGRGRREISEGDEGRIGDESEGNRKGRKKKKGE